MFSSPVVNAETVVTTIQLIGIALSASLFLTESVLTLWLLVTRRRSKTFWGECACLLRRRPWGESDVVWVLGILFLINLPGLLQTLSPTPSPLPPPVEATAVSSSTTGTLIMLMHPLLLYGGILLIVRHRLGVRDRSWHEAFGGYAKDPGHDARLGVLYGLAAVPAIVVVSGFYLLLLQLMRLPIDPQPAILWVTSAGLSSWQRALLLLLVIVIAPIAEELLFRGVLFPAALRHMSWPRALCLQGLLFGAVHLHLPSLGALTTAGMLFGMGYLVTGSLLTPILMHVIFNATSILLLFSFNPC